ncbi:MAG: DinB family protein, partial [Anaerolineae bacterium]|nr:DinB family protein [Anaerolineae bacterium]
PTWRQQLLALMALERARLLGRLLGLDEELLNREELFEGHTAARLLAHIAAWDRIHEERLALVLAGRTEALVSLDLDEQNARLLASHENWAVGQAVRTMGDAREQFLATLAEANDAQLHEPIDLPWADALPLRTWAVWRARHDAGHRADIERWRHTSEPAWRIGPRSLLYAALEASHDALVALAALVPEREREDRPLVDEWSARDILGHVADWEQYGEACLRAGGMDEISDSDVDVWNAAHAAARRDDSYETVVAALEQSGAGLLAALAERPSGMSLPNLWGRDMSAYAWAEGYVEHALEHVEMLQAALLAHLLRKG